MIRDVILAICIVLIIITPVFGQQPPCVYPRMDQVNPHVQTIVTKSPSGFDYDYRVENKPGARQFLIRFAVQAFTTDGATLAQSSPSNWEARGRIRDTDLYSWTTFTEPRGLAGGASAVGFRLANASLPAIVTFLAWNDVEPPSFPEGMAPDSCEGDDILENSFKGKTVGPKPPPRDFVPIEFLNYLITLVHDSRQLNWITRDGAHKSLLAKLINAKRKLEEGQPAVAKNMLNAFLNEVEATSCQEFSCPGNKPLTSEAFALLFFNGQFLVDRLP